MSRQLLPDDVPTVAAPPLELRRSSGVPAKRRDLNMTRLQKVGRWHEALI